ncbi:MAG: hypothetical protein OXH57_06695, partial [Ekhidna sp.]|nr:hypothetical protein [Ekhidna sp.]
MNRISDPKALKSLFNAAGVHKYAPPPRNVQYRIKNILFLAAALTFAFCAQAQMLSVSAPANANEGNAGTQDLLFTVSL